MAHDSSSSHVPYQKAYGSLSGKSGAQIWVEIQAVHSHLWRSDRSTLLHHGPRSFPFRQASKPRACIAPKSTTLPNWTVDPPKSPKAPVSQKAQKVFYKNTVNTFCTAPLGFTFWWPICHCIAFAGFTDIFSKGDFSPSSASLTG